MLSLEEGEKIAGCYGSNVRGDFKFLNAGLGFCDISLEFLMPLATGFFFRLIGGRVLFVLW